MLAIDAITMEVVCRQEGAKAPAYVGWYCSALDRRLEFCIAAEKVIDLLPAVVICIGHLCTFQVSVPGNDRGGQ